MGTDNSLGWDCDERRESSVGNEDGNSFFSPAFPGRLSSGRMDSISVWIWAAMTTGIQNGSGLRFFTGLPPWHAISGLLRLCLLKIPSVLRKNGVIWNQVAHAGGNPLDPGGSVGVHVGYKGRFVRIEAEWSRRWRRGILRIREYPQENVTPYDSWFDRQVHGITNVRSQDLFLNIYHDFSPVRNVTPYVGVGQGVLFVDMDYFLLQQYRSDAEVLEYLGGIPQVASSITILDSTPEDHLQAVQVMAGLGLSSGRPVAGRCKASVDGH